MRYRFPGASGLLLGLRLFELVPNVSDLGKGGAPGAKGATPNAAFAGLITDLSRAHAHSRPLTIRDLRVLMGQLAPFNDAVRASAVCVRPTACGLHCALESLNLQSRQLYHRAHPRACICNSISAVPPFCSCAAAACGHLHLSQQETPRSRLQAGLLFAVLLQLLFGETLSRLLARGPSPFLACLSVFCAAQTLRCLLPTVLAPFSVQVQLDRNQRTFVLCLMALLGVVFALLLTTHGLDVDVALGARALRQTEAFWAGVGSTLLEIKGFVTSGRLPQSGAHSCESAAAGDDGADDYGEDAAHEAAVRSRVAPDGRALQRQSFWFCHSGCASCTQNLRETYLQGRIGLLRRLTVQGEARQGGEGYVVPLTLALAFTAGPFAALLVLPLLRAARCAWAVLHPPFEAIIEEHSPGASAGMPLSAPAVTRAAVAAAAVAPAFAALLWVRPVAEGLLGLGAQQRAAAQGAALILCGVHQRSYVKMRSLDMHCLGLRTAVERRSCVVCPCMQASRSCSACVRCYKPTSTPRIPAGIEPRTRRRHLRPERRLRSRRVP